MIQLYYGIPNKKRICHIKKLIYKGDYLKQWIYQNYYPKNI